MVLTLTIHRIYLLGFFLYFFKRQMAVLYHRNAKYKDLQRGSPEMFFSLEVTYVILFHSQGWTPPSWAIGKGLCEEPHVDEDCEEAMVIQTPLNHSGKVPQSNYHIYPRRLESDIRPSVTLVRTHRISCREYIFLLLPMTPKGFMSWVGINKISAEFNFFF